VKPIIIHLHREMSIDKEARDYIYKMNKRLNVPPIAIVAGTFNESLVANFYQKFYKPQTPYKIFKKENEACDWLNKIWEQ
jgi:hypothetical protein